ncbi:MAG: hypothetical protein HY904_18215 [Deltaproteobacteria bacterium]|nr:hypothetical protein [Deltaproteobacteria bacterium]
MAAPTALDDRARADIIGGLTFSAVVPRHPLAAIRAAQWFNLAGPLQQGAPFFLVHDVGLALAYGQSRTVEVSPRQPYLEEATRRGVLRRGAAEDAALAGYARLMQELVRGTLAVRLSSGGLSDNVMGALLAKVLEPVGLAQAAAGSVRRELPLDPALFEVLRPPEVLSAEAAAVHLEVVRRVAERAQAILLATEQVDLDTLKLMQMMGGMDVAGDPAAVLDLYRVLDSPQTHDIVDFCLDLVPQLLETSRSKGAQTFSVGGYASIETKGNLDSLLPSELAYDDTLFEQRYSEGELLYFGREKDSRERERLHYILVDASAAMRGLRTTFSRGLALALCKKLTLRGETVWLRFFDSRLHDRLEVTARSLKLPHIMGFRSERGRNAARVFEDLDLEVGRLVRDEGRDVLVTLITHGRLSIPDAVAERLAQKAAVYGVFVLPSQPVDLPYARRFRKTHVVDADALVDPQARARAAMGVLESA